MSDELPVADLTYVSSKRAAEISGYAQDYIGQLARKGLIASKRVGGLWYVDMDSLESYKKGTPESPDAVEKKQESDNQQNDSVVSFDGKDYISANRASKLTGYNQDYVGQLARSGKILSRQVGNRWFIDREGIMAHKEEKDSLLAAVQSESVGIYRKDPLSRPLPPAASPVIGRREPELMTYVHEDAELLPPIGTSEEEDEVEYARPQPHLAQTQQTSPVTITGSNRNNGQYYSNRREIPIQETVPQPISPIPIARSAAITIKKPAIPPSRASQRPQMLKKPSSCRKIPLGFAALILTGIAAASIAGIMFFPGTDAKIKSFGMNAGVMKLVPMSLLATISDAFENLLAPELVYQRKD